MAALYRDEYYTTCHTPVGESYPVTCQKNVRGFGKFIKNNSRYRPPDTHTARMMRLNI